MSDHAVHRATVDQKTPAFDELALTTKFATLARTAPEQFTALSQMTADAGIDVVPHGDFERSLDLETLG